MGEIPELSDEVIQEVVGRKLHTKNVKVVESHLQPMDEKIGLLAEHRILNLKIQKQEGKPIENLSFFVKIFPSVPLSAEFATKTGAFDKECFTFELFSKISNSLLEECSPICYNFNNTRLIMENLLSEGFRNVDKTKTLDIASVRVVLDALAKLHACTLMHEEEQFRVSNKPYRLIDDYRNRLKESFFIPDEPIVAKAAEASIRCVLEEIELFDFPKRLPSGKNFQAVAEKVCRNIYNYVNPSDTHRNVITHGDLWATNFLIKYKNDKPAACKLVDFQCARYTPPAQDVLALFFQTTSRDFRRKYMFNLIGEYYAFLERYMKLGGFKLESVMSLKDFISSCEQEKAFAVVQAALHYPLVLVNSKDLEQYLRNPFNHTTALEENRIHLVLAFKDKDEHYKQRLIESVQELYDLCSFM